MGIVHSECSCIIVLEGREGDLQEAAEKFFSRKRLLRCVSNCHESGEPPFQSVTAINYVLDG